MVHGRKRQRTSAGHAHVQRPIGKSLIFVEQSTGTSNTSTTLITATFPCTILGVRWDGYASALLVPGPMVVWAIVIVREGNSDSAIGISDGSTFYNPEQNVLAYGVMNPQGSGFPGGPVSVHFDGQTKTMRKLQGGDRLMFIARSDIAAGPDIACVVQFFCKS